jgi:ribosomal protein S19
MKKYQKRNQKIMSSIINKKYLVHNGRKFIFIKVKSNIIGYTFGSFVNTKK